MGKTIAIIGSGDLGQLIAYHTLAMEVYSKAVFFDDFKHPGEKIGLGVVIGGISKIGSSYLKGEFNELIVGIGYNHMQLRKDLFNKFYPSISFATIIHKSSYVDKSVKIGKGVFILPGCTIDYNSTIEDNVLLNTACTIAHDSIVCSHSFLSPRVAMAGFSKIGECCVIGINSTIIDNITIAENTKIGGGCVVVKDIEYPGLYVGIPAKRIKDSI